MEIGKFKPCGDRVLIEVLPRENVSAGGILMPDARAGRANRGRVVSVGPGRPLANGARAPMTVTVGDVVLFDPYRVAVAIGPDGARAGATEHAQAGDHALVREVDVIGIEE